MNVNGGLDAFGVQDEIARAFDRGVSIAELSDRYGYKHCVVKRLIAYHHGYKFFSYLTDALARKEQRAIAAVPASANPPPACRTAAAPGVLNIHSGRFLERCMAIISEQSTSTVNTDQWRKKHVG